MPLGRDRQREALELILLSVLSEGPRYGYAIIKQVAAQSDGSIRLTAGGLYPLLHALERERLVASSWETIRSDRADSPDAGEGRKRKWYRLSAKGRRRLAQRVKAHRAQQAMIESFLPLAAEADEGHPA